MIYAVGEFDAILTRRGRRPRRPVCFRRENVPEVVLRSKTGVRTFFSPAAKRQIQPYPASDDKKGTRTGVISKVRAGVRTHTLASLGGRFDLIPLTVAERENSDESLFSLSGAGSGGRTRTVSLPLDFESSTSANSIIPAQQKYYTTK